jgi:hypothetical protein
MEVRRGRIPVTWADCFNVHWQIIRAAINS